MGGGGGHQYCCGAKQTGPGAVFPKCCASCSFVSNATLKPGPGPAHCIKFCLFVLISDGQRHECKAAKYKHPSAVGQNLISLLSVQQCSHRPHTHCCPAAQASNGNNQHACQSRAAAASMSYSPRKASTQRPAAPFPSHTRQAHLRCCAAGARAPPPPPPACRCPAASRACARCQACMPQQWRRSAPRPPLPPPQLAVDPHPGRAQQTPRRRCRRWPPAGLPPQRASSTGCWARRQDLPQAQQLPQLPQQPQLLQTAAWRPCQWRPACGQRRPSCRQPAAPPLPLPLQPPLPPQ